MKCLRCGARVDAVQIDDTAEQVLVSGPAVFAAFKMPGLAGYVTDHVRLVHVCSGNRAQQATDRLRAKRGGGK